MAVMPDSFGAHPVLACVERVGAELAQVAAVPVELMSTGDKAAALVAVSTTLDQLQGLRLRLLAAAEDVSAEAGACDAGAWLAHRTRRERREEQRDQRLGTALERWQHIAAGLTSGVVNLAQARVIAHALDALPDDLDAAVLARAEAQLVAYATEFGPAELRVLGRRILDVVAPEVGEAAEARALEDEERRAAEHTLLILASCGDGTTRLSGRLPDAAAHRLATYLDAFTSPRQHGRGSGPHGEDEAGPVERGPVERRRGQAFCALLEHLDPAKLPDHGGEATTVMVTMTLDQLRNELATAGIISGDDLKISGGQARRLACNAGIIPVVLGGKSEVLDLGRTRRLHNRPQRKALRIIHQRCRARGCTVPATWCEAHHLTPWALGGPTDLAHAVLLCPWHHHRAHDPTYDVTRRPDGDLEFRRRRTRNP